MEKNTIFAFLIILLMLLFFNSGQWQKVEEKLGWRKTVTTQDSITALPGETEGGESIVSGPDSQKAMLVRPADTLALKAAPAEHAITIVSSKYVGVITNQGAKILSWKLKGWGRDSSALELIPRETGGVLGLKIKGEWTGESPWESGVSADTFFISSGNENVVNFVYKSKNQYSVLKKFKFYPDRYDFDLEILCSDGKEGEYELLWDAGIRESEDERMSYMQNPEIIFGMQEGTSKKTGIKAGKIQEEKGYADFVALKSRYFFAGMIFEKINNPQNVSIIAQAADTQNSNSEYNIKYKVVSTLDDGKAKEKVVLGPADYKLARSYERNFGHVVFSGWSWFIKADVWFPYLCQLVLYVLTFFYNLIPNYGVSILLLTILFRLVTFPLTLKSSKSMARLKDLQPKITEIREKFKNEPMKQQQLTMKLYKEMGVNPFGAGCLPQLLQMPIFIALYIALRKAVELRGAGFCLWIQDLSGPEYIPLLRLPMKIPFYGDQVSSLAIFMAVTMFFSSKQTITDPRQKSMIYMMPVIMLVMMNQMPAGLLLYWAVSNVLGIFQNMIIMKNTPPSQMPGAELKLESPESKKTKKKPLFSLPKVQKKGGAYRWK